MMEAHTAVSILARNVDKGQLLQDREFRRWEVPRRRNPPIIQYPKKSARKLSLLAENLYLLGV
jgi:hypothetical protein